MCSKEIMLNIVTLEIEPCWFTPRIQRLSIAEPRLFIWSTLSLLQLRSFHTNMKLPVVVDTYYQCIAVFTVCAIACESVLANGNSKKNIA